MGSEEGYITLCRSFDVKKGGKWSGDWQMTWNQQRTIFFKMNEIKGGLSMALIHQREKMRKKKRVTVKAKALGKGEKMRSKT